MKISKTTLREFYYSFYLKKENEYIKNGELKFFDNAINGSSILFVLHSEFSVFALIVAEIIKDSLEVEFITVKDQYKNKGFSKLLLMKQFEFAKKNNLQIINSRYSDDGENYLKKTNRLYSKKYEVIFKEYGEL
jgi:GNAT superfamily N-acetyltransferase